jgi:hypothetical protein
MLLDKFRTMNRLGLIVVNSTKHVDLSDHANKLKTRDIDPILRGVKLPTSC